MINLVNKFANLNLNSCSQWDEYQLYKDYNKQAKDFGSSERI